MQTENTENGVLETWTPQEVSDALNKGEIVLIDVRTPAEYSFEHVHGAMLLPMSFFDPAFLPGQCEKRIVLMCGSSKRSERVARQVLAAGGRQIAHLEGGLGRWKDEKLPYIATDMATGAPIMPG